MNTLCDILMLVISILHVGLWIIFCFGLVSIFEHPDMKALICIISFFIIIPYGMWTCSKFGKWFKSNCK